MARTPFFVRLIRKKGCALAARILTGSRKPRGGDLDAVNRYPWHLGRRFTLKPAHNKRLHRTAAVACAPSVSGGYGIANVQSCCNQGLHGLIGNDALLLKVALPGLYPAWAVSTLNCHGNFHCRLGSDCQRSKAMVHDRAFACTALAQVWQGPCIFCVIRMIVKITRLHACQVLP